MHDAIALPQDIPAAGPWTHTHGKAERKAKRFEKRRDHQAERARVKEHLHAGLQDPDAFLDLESRSKNTRRLLASGKEDRAALFTNLHRKARAELNNTRDLEDFLAKASRSRTLHTLVALGYFRHVLRSEAIRDDHRYKLAIVQALEEPGLSRSIHKRWHDFDREFPDRRGW